MGRKAVRKQHFVRMFWALCLFLVAIFLWIFLEAPKQNVGFREDQEMRMDNSWEVSYGNHTELKTLPAQINNSKAEKITMTTDLRYNKVLNYSLLFYTKQTRVMVYLDQKLIYDTGDQVYKPYRFAYGSFWNCVRLPQNAAGKKLAIELTPEFSVKEVTDDLPAVYIGTKAAFMYKIIDAHWPMLFLCLVVIIFSIGYIFMGVFYVYRDVSESMIALGLFAVFVSYWQLSECHVLQLVFSNEIVMDYLKFTVFAMIPFIWMYFCVSCKPIQKFFYMRIIFYVGFLVEILFQILPILKISYPLHLEWMIQGYTMLIIIGTIAVFVSVIRKKQFHEYKETYVGIAIIIICSIMELIRFITVRKYAGGNIIMIGMVLFIFHMGGSLVKKGIQMRGEDIEHQALVFMAYTDSLTGMENRSAFEEKMCELRERATHGKETSELRIMIADVNCLKYINDHFGHAEGDEAIRFVSSQIKKHFGKIGKCFRIGGDEYCVILENCEELLFQRKLESFLADIEQCNRTYPLKVATGYCKQEELSIDDTFIMADKKMYECKLRIKREEGKYVPEDR